MIFAFILFLVFSMCMLMAAYKDATSMTIPNWISLALIGAFFVMLPFTWAGPSVFAEHLLVGLTFFAAGFAMFAFGWLGGGDAKMMAATALWWTWPDAVNYIYFSAAFGGILGLALLLGRRYIPVRVLTSEWAYMMFKDQKKMPYGLALAAGGIVTLLKSDIFLRAVGA